MCNSRTDYLLLNETQKTIGTEDPLTNTTQTPTVSVTANAENTTLDNLVADESIIIVLQDDMEVINVLNNFQNSITTWEGQE